MRTLRRSPNPSRACQTLRRNPSSGILPSAAKKLRIAFYTCRLKPFDGILKPFRRNSQTLRRNSLPPGRSGDRGWSSQGAQIAAFGCLVAGGQGHRSPRTRFCPSPPPRERLVAVCWAGVDVGAAALRIDTPVVFGVAEVC